MTNGNIDDLLGLPSAPVIAPPVIATPPRPPYTSPPPRSRGGRSADLSGSVFGAAWGLLALIGINISVLLNVPSMDMHTLWFNSVVDYENWALPLVTWDGHTAIPLAISIAGAIALVLAAFMAQGFTRANAYGSFGTLAGIALATLGVAGTFAAAVAILAVLVVGAVLVVVFYVVIIGITLAMLICAMLDN